MDLRPQKQLKDSWNSDISLVSICCITYNHEKYIEDALNSFLMQKTDFPLEVIIHDDASSDSTADIIRGYEEKYPEIIRPIYQTENQKSKLGSGMNPTFNYPRAKGKYIALCEGDDYWTDPLKLQKQVEFMEKNPDVNICFTYSKKRFESQNEMESENKCVKIEYSHFDFLIGKKWQTKTASTLFRNNSFSLHEMQKYLSSANSGDTWLKLFCSRDSKGVLLPFYGAVYRIHNNSTWSSLDSLVLNKKKLTDWKLKYKYALKHEIKACPIIMKNIIINYLKIYTLKNYSNFKR